MPTGIKGPKIKKYCLFCRKEFKVKLSRKDTAKFCSRKCYYKSMKGRIVWNKNRKMTDYPQIGFQKGHLLYQTIETRKKISKALTGKNNGNYKGGITPFNKIDRRGIEMKLWREAVYERDNWICQKCKIRGLKLRSHHIQNFAQFPELRFAIDNGITFCEKCHQKFHKIYGIKNNNKEQVIEFCKSRRILKWTTI